MAKRISSLRCPTCRKLVVRGEPDYPFCSERCRLIDLGKWASGGYVISTPIQEADQFGEDYTGQSRTHSTTSDAAKTDGKFRRS